MTILAWCQALTEPARNPFPTPNIQHLFNMAIVVPPSVSDSEFRRLVLTALSEGVTVGGITLSGDISFGKVEIDQTGGKNGVSVVSSALPTGAATQTTLASVLAKMITAPATEAKQDTGNTALASILAKLADPATSAKQDTGNSSLASIASGMATQATLAAVLAKLSADPATQTTLAAILAKLTNVNTSAVTISSGSVVASDPTVLVAKSTTLSSSLIAKASAGSLESISGYNSGPAQWIQIHNATSVPANGAVPLAIIPVSAQSGFFYEWQKGLPCSTGITICNSYGSDPATAAAQKTIGSNDCFFTATYI